jgi:hypothetical protein
MMDKEEREERRITRWLSISVLLMLIIFAYTTYLDARKKRTVIDKHIGDFYTLVLRDENGIVVSRDVDVSWYYYYEIGDQYEPLP